MTANQEPTVSPTNRRISAWCAAGRKKNQGGTVQHCAALVVVVRDEIYRLLGKLILRQLPVEVFRYGAVTLRRKSSMSRCRQS